MAVVGSHSRLEEETSVRGTFPHGPWSKASTIIYLENLLPYKVMCGWVPSIRFTPVSSQPTALVDLFDRDHPRTCSHVLRRNPNTDGTKPFGRWDGANDEEK